MEWVDKAMRARSNKERHRLLIEARYLGKPPPRSGFHHEQEGPGIPGCRDEAQNANPCLTVANAQYEGQIDGPVAFLVPEARAEAIVEEHQDGFLEQGCYLIQTRDTAGKGGDAVAIFPTRDVYQVLAALQTEGANSNVYNRDLIRWLRSLSEPLRVTGAGYDFLSGRFLKPIGNPTALMKSVAKICPDADDGPSSLRAQAKRLAETRELFLWWD